jgi:Apea-like HEPN
MMPDWDYIQESEDFVWQELSRIPYRRDLETSIRMYTRALDARDWITSFVRLWALLETLTATHRHQEVVRRVLPMVKGEHKDFHRQILRHLYGYRNKTVHTGHETVALEALLYQPKFHAEKLLEFHPPLFQPLRASRMQPYSSTLQLKRRCRDA